MGFRSGRRVVGILNDIEWFVDRHFGMFKTTFSNVCEIGACPAHTEIGTHKCGQWPVSLQSAILSLFWRVMASICHRSSLLSGMNLYSVLQQYCDQIDETMPKTYCELVWIPQSTQPKKRQVLASSHGNASSHNWSSPRLRLRFGFPSAWLFQHVPTATVRKGDQPYSQWQ